MKFQTRKRLRKFADGFMFWTVPGCMFAAVWTFDYRFALTGVVVMVLAITRAVKDEDRLDTKRRLRTAEHNAEVYRVQLAQLRREKRLMQDEIDVLRTGRATRRAFEDYDLDTEG